MRNAKRTFDNMEVLGECDICKVWGRVTEKTIQQIDGTPRKGIFCAIHLRRENERPANNAQTRRKNDFDRVLQHVIKGVEIQ